MTESVKIHPRHENALDLDVSHSTGSSLLISLESRFFFARD